MSKTTRFALRFPPLVLCALALGACPSSDPTDPDPDPATLTLALSPTSASVQQGGSTSFQATATTGGGFSGSVAFSVTGAPAGITGSVSGVTVSGSTASGTVTIDAAASTTPGVYPLTVTAEGSTAPDATASFSLTVTAAPDYALSLSAATLSVTQGTSGTRSVTITRTNFTGAVTLALASAPTGVTGSFDPSAPTGTSSTLTVSIGGSVAPGTYNLTVNGTAAPGNRSTALALTVTASGGGGPTPVTVSFAACPVDQQPVWFAYQDGSGTWTRVMPAANAYSFTLAQSTGGVAFVNDYGEDGTEIQVHYMTAAELNALTTPLCYIESTTVRSFQTGTLAGMSTGDIAFVSLGGYWTPALTAGSPLQLGVPTGTHDLVGFRYNGGAPASNRGLFRRGVVISGAGSGLGTVDFDGSESFAAASATLTVGGLSGGEVLVQNTGYYTEMCKPGIFSAGAFPAPSFTAYGMPAAQQATNDLHLVTIFAHSDGTSDPVASRTVLESFKTLAARTITLGAALPAPTLSTLGGPYKRLQVVFTRPADYDRGVGFSYEHVSLLATNGYLGGTAVTLAMPDLSGVTGWSNPWAPASGGSSDWRIDARGGALGSPCGEGARTLSAYRRGTF